MPLGMASCPLDFPRPGFLPAGFSAAWRLVRWIFRGMASFPLDFSRLRFSLGSSPRRRPRGYERGLARGARRCRLPRRFAKITRCMHVSSGSESQDYQTESELPMQSQRFWVCVRSFSGRLARGRNIIF